MVEHANRRVSLRVLGVWVILVVLLTLAFIAQQQSAQNASQAAVAQASAQAAEATQEQIALNAQATAAMALTEAQSQAANAATQSANAENSAATAVAQVNLQATNDSMATSSAQQLATAQAEQAATLTAQAAQVTTAYTQMQGTLAAQSESLASISSQATVQAAEVTTAYTQMQGTLAAQSESLASLASQATAQAEALTTAQAQAVTLRDVQAHSAAAQSLLALNQRHDALALLMGIEASVQSGGQINQPLFDALNTHPDIAAYLNGHLNTIYALAFSPNGKMLVSGSRDYSVRVWDTTSRQPLSPSLQEHADSVFALAFSPDSKHFASGGADKVVVIWDVDTWTPHRLTGHTNYIDALAYSPDGKILASGSSDNSIILWDTSTYQQIAQLTGHTDLVRALAFSPDGTVLASGSGDQSIILWNVPEHILGRRFSSNVGWIQTLAFSPDGKSLASGGGNNQIDIWDVRSGEPRSTVTGFTDFINHVAYSPDGTRLVSVSANKVQVWDISGSAPTQLNEYDGTDVWVANYAPDDSSLAISDGTAIALWNPANTEPRLSQTLLEVPGDNFSSVAIHRDDQTLIAADTNEVVSQWNLETGTADSAAPATGAAMRVAYSPDGNWLVLAEGKAITVFDHATNQTVYQFTGPTNTIDAIAFSPNSQTLASIDENGTVWRWNLDNGQALDSGITVNQGGVNTLAYSPDGEILATSDTNNYQINLWDAVSGEAIGDPIPSAAQVYTMAFSPDSRILVGGGSYAPLMLWDVATRQAVPVTLDSAAYGVDALVFTPDGKSLITSNADHQLLFFDTSNWQIREKLDTSLTAILKLSITSDGQKLIVVGVFVNGAGDSANKISAFSLNPSDWLDTACKVTGRNLTLTEWQSTMGSAPYHRTCDNWPVDSSVYEPLADQALAAAKAGDTETATAAYQQVVDLLGNTQDAGLNNTVCWYGSLYGYAKIVLPACERAVALSNNYPVYTDSRGLARALTGDLQGAIPDFQAYADWSQIYGYFDIDGSQRLKWITALTAGQNPFDDVTLQDLRSQ